MIPPEIEDLSHRAKIAILIIFAAFVVAWVMLPW